MARSIAVVIKNLIDNSPPITLSLENSILLGELRTLWESKSGIPSHDLFFVMENNKRVLPSEGTLANVLPDDAFYVALSVQSMLEISVCCCCIPSLNWRFPILSHTTAADVLSDVRLQLSLPASSEMILRINNEVTDWDTKIKDIQQSSDGPLTAEVDVQVAVKALKIRPQAFYDPILENDNQLLVDDETGYVPAFGKDLDDRPIARNCFLSDPASSLILSEDCVFNQQRLVSADRKKSILAEMRLGELISASDLATGCSAFIEQAMTLFVTSAKEKVVQEVMVWPTDSLRIICKSPGQSLRFNGEKLSDMDASFLELGIGDKSFIEVTEVIQVTVHDCRSCMREMEIDQDMAFTDLLLLLEANASTPKFFVTIDDTTVLSSTASLRSLGAREGSEIKVWCESRPVKLLYNSEEVQTENMSATSKFEDLLRLARSIFGVSFPEDTRFQCLCGRIVSAESDRRRAVPFSCCADVTLRVIAPEDKKIETSDVIQALRCRLPRHCSLEALDWIRKFSTSRTERHRRLSEVQLWRAVLKLLDATDVRMTVPDATDVAVQLTTGKRLELSVPRNSRLSSLLASVVDRGFERAGSSLSIRGARLEPYQLEKTFAELEFRNGQVLWVEPPPRPDAFCQTDKAPHLNSSRYSSISIQCANKSNVRPTAANQARADKSNVRPRTSHQARDDYSNVRPRTAHQAPLANFRVVCSWRPVDEIYLSLPRPVYGRDLRRAVQEVEPQAWKLTQWRASQMVTGTPAVDLGNHVYAGRDGERVNWFVPLPATVQDWEELLIPGNKYALIFADR